MTDSTTIIRDNCLRLANGDMSKALDYAAQAVDWYKRHCSAGFIWEDPAHNVRPPKPAPDAILTHDGL